MSFFNLGYSLTKINSILERDDFTLEQLLDEQDVVQECSKDNKQLVEFLSKPPVLLQMLEFAIGAPDEDAEEAVRYKYPSVATDILSVGVYGICQGLISGEKVWKGKTLMQRLWSFLDNPAPLNPLLASYFSKIAGGLLQKKSTDVLAFVRQDKTILDKLLNNMGTSAVMELLTSIFGDRDLKHANGVMEWLTEEKLVMRLVKHVSGKSTSDMQANASQALVEVVSLNKLTIEYLGPDPIVTQLYNPEILKMLVEQLIAKDATGTLISNGIDVFLSLMNAGQLPVTGEEQVQQLSEQSLLQLSLQSADVGRVLAPHVKAFVALLRAGSQQRKITMTFGELHPPFGTHRLKVVELMMGMVGNTKLVEVTKDMLVECEVAGAMFDQFFKYKWNNMLHSMVERYVVGVLDYASTSQDGEALAKATLFDATLMDRIVYHNSENKNRSMGGRDGFMGSVLVMANAINAFFGRKEQPAYIVNMADNLSDEWKDFVKIDLAVVNEKNERPLGGHRPNNNTDDEEEFDVGGDCSGDINQDLAYMRFLSQQISSAPSNDDFLSSSSDEESDLSDEISDEDEGDRIFRPAVLENAFAPDAFSNPQSSQDDTNEAIAAAFDRATIHDGGHLAEDDDFEFGSQTEAHFGDTEDEEASSAEETNATENVDVDGTAPGEAATSASMGMEEDTYDKEVKGEAMDEDTPMNDSDEDTVTIRGATKTEDDKTGDTIGETVIDSDQTDQPRESEVEMAQPTEEPKKVAGDGSEAVGGDAA